MTTAPILAFAQVDHHHEAAWVIVGLVLGLIAAAITRRGLLGLLADLVVGIIGGVAGGLVFHALKRGGRHTLPFLWHDVVAAVVGAAILLLLLEAVSTRQRVQ